MSHLADSAVLEAREADSLREPQPPAAAHAHARAARAGGGWSAARAGARPGAAPASRSGRRVASPSISTRQRGELARIRHSPPPARATVRANGGRERDDASRRPGGDRGRRDAVDAPAGEARTPPRPPGPTTSGRRTRRPSSSPRRRSRRPASARRNAPVTRAPSRCGAQYWPSHGTDLRGAERARTAAAASRARASKRALQAPGRGRRSASRSSALQQGRRRRRRPSRTIHALSAISVRSNPSGSDGQRDHRPRPARVAADARDRADAPVRRPRSASSSPRTRRRARAAGRRTGGRRRCGGRASARDQGVGDGDVPAGLGVRERFVLTVVAIALRVGEDHDPVGGERRQRVVDRLRGVGLADLRRRRRCPPPRGARRCRSRRSVASAIASSGSETQNASLDWLVAGERTSTSAPLTSSPRVSRRNAASIGSGVTTSSFTRLRYPRAAAGKTAGRRR